MAVYNFFKMHASVYCISLQEKIQPQIITMTSKNRLTRLSTGIYMTAIIILSTFYRVGRVIKMRGDNSRK